MKNSPQAEKKESQKRHTIHSRETQGKRNSVLDYFKKEKLKNQESYTAERLLDQDLQKLRLNIRSTMYFKYQENKLTLTRFLFRKCRDKNVGAGG